MSEAPIRFENVTKKYGRKVALSELNWDVPQGNITALLGPNGAGKTTAIKLMVGLHAADQGQVTLLGRDARRLRSREFAQLGYVSENQKLPDWMTVTQFLDYCRPLYPTWDKDLERQLVKQFALPMHQKLKQLSRGQAMKAALLSSMSYRPQVLILDEPFSGLDALSRDEFIGGLLELMTGDGWTVCISSHDFFEVERLADHLAILDQGHLKVNEPASELQARMKRIVLSLPAHEPLPKNLPVTWQRVERSGDLLRFVDTVYQPDGHTERLSALLPAARLMEVNALSLREIFVCLSLQYRWEQAAGVTVENISAAS